MKKYLKYWPVLLLTVLSAVAVWVALTQSDNEEKPFMTEQERERARIIRQAEIDADISKIDVPADTPAPSVEDYLEENPEVKTAIEKAREHVRRLREKQAQEQEQNQ
jgi:DNA repair exonuclease SbcCD nuclease subunit